MLKIISHKGEAECRSFFNSFFDKNKKALFVGTLGFSDACLFFPTLTAHIPDIDVLFLVEKRPEVSEVLEAAALQNKAELEKILAAKNIEFAEVKIVADDTANVAGRSATQISNLKLKGQYTDVIIDATTMSRGVCFPIVKQVFESNNRHPIHTHVVVAESNNSNFKVQPMSSDTPEYMHGFHGDMDTDQVTQAIKLWLPQLSEENLSSLKRIQSRLQAEEVAPILPFPSADPRRGDNLLREFCDPLINDWDLNLSDIIYAHESDPMDVFATIKRIYLGREQALAPFTNSPGRLILSPTGRKIGSLGMLFAAIDLDLPVMYTETMGYQCNETSIPKTTLGSPPRYVWHNWLIST